MYPLDLPPQFLYFGCSQLLLGLVPLKPLEYALPMLAAASLFRSAVRVRSTVGSWPLTTCTDASSCCVSFFYHQS